MATNLIPLSYLNEACFLSTNIDAKKLQMALNMAQEDFSDLIGSSMYDEILSQYPDSLTTANATLYEGYIKNHLAWTTYYNHLKFSQSESTPTGERQHTDENSTILDDVKLFSKEKNVRNTAKRYADRMINFLILSRSKDSTSYPKWIGNCKRTMGFGFSIIRKGDTDQVISMNRTQVRNE